MDNKLKIKVDNVDYSMVELMWFGVSILLVVAMMIALGILNSLGSDGSGIIVIMLILFVVFFGAPFLIIFGLKTEIDYDGKYIRYQNRFGKKEIDIQKTNKVRYRIYRTRGRSSRNQISLEFELDNEDTRNFYDVISDEQMQEVFRGNREKVPLFELYTKIITLYPEKDGGEQENDPY